MPEDIVVETKKPNKIVRFLLMLVGLLVVIILVEAGYYLFDRYSSVPVKISGSVNEYSIQVGDSNTFDNLLKETGFGSSFDKKYYAWEKEKWQNFSNVVVTFT